MIQVIEGNMLDYDDVIIVQQVNTLSVMGGGLSGQIMSRYPEVPIEYKKYIKKRMKKATSTRELLGEVLLVDVYDGKIIANIFGQNDVRTDHDDTNIRYTEYDALFEGLRTVKTLAERLNCTLALPTYLGCGLGNGDWVYVREEIENIFADNTVAVRFFHYR